MHDVSTVIDRNYAHPGMTYAFNWFERWKQEASKGFNVPIPGEMAVAHDNHVNPIDFIKEAAAMYWLYEGQKGLIINDRHLTYCIGWRILRTTTHRMYQNGVGPRRRKAGKYVQENLGPLLRNIVKQCRQIHHTGQDNIQIQIAEMI